MPSPWHPNRTLPAFVVVVAGVVLLQSPAAVAAPPQPEFQLPFACGEAWYGSTRASHTPSPFAIDWNRDANDLGHVVVATQSGTVSSVTNLGNASYGLYIVIGHDDVWSSLYAHLEASFVAPGQHVDEGQPVGLLGDSGNTTGPHLHYEQRHNGNDRHAVFDETRFTYDSWLRSADCPDVPIAGNWNGKGRSEVGAFGRRPSVGVFRERRASGKLSKIRFGLATDQPVIGDWDGDGMPDVGIWRTTKRLFVLKNPAAGRQSFHFGRRGDIGVVGDWDGDGSTNVGVFRPATATFRLLDGLGAVTTQTFGTPGSIPIAGDWDGDGHSQVGVYDPATSTFSLAMGDGVTKTLTFGSPNSLPVVGSWNRDRRSDVGVWDPVSGIFSKRLGPHRTVTIRFGRRR